MARYPKGSRNNAEKAPEVAQVAVHGSEIEEKPLSPRMIAFSFDTTVYHETEEPRTLKAGSPVPEGWTTEPGTLSVRWKNNSDGSWYKEKP